MVRFSLGLMLSAVLTAGPASAAETEYPPLPEGFSSFGAAVHDGFVYVYGGHTGKPHTYSTDTVTGKFRRLNIAKPAAGWEELTPGPALQGLALVSHGNTIIRIGGMAPQNKDGEKARNLSVASVAAFDVVTKTWKDLPDMPAGRSSFDAVVVDDKLVVVGGWKMGGVSRSGNWADTSLILDLKKSPLAWEVVPQAFQRRALNAAALGGKVYAVGGMNEDNEMQREVDVLDIATKTWTKGTTLPDGRMNGFTPAVCVAGGKIYASPADGKVYRLEGDRWDEVGKLAKTRLVHRIVPAADGLLVLGGASKEGNVRVVEFIRPGPVVEKTSAVPSP